VNAERMKELRAWIEEVQFNDQAEMLGDIPADLLSLLSSHEKVLEENEKLRADKEALREALKNCCAMGREEKVRAEKAEAALALRQRKEKGEGG